MRSLKDQKEEVWRQVQANLRTGSQELRARNRFTRRTALLASILVVLVLGLIGLVALMDRSQP